MSDDKLLKEIDQGAKADSLLRNETYRNAVNAVREGIHEQWSKSPLRDIEGQKYLRLMLKALDDVEGNIRHVANTGKLAMAQREHELTLKQRAEKLARGLLDRIS